MKKVKFDVIKPWISQKITELLGFEDEVLIGYIYSLLEEKQEPDPKHLQINITGFLAKDASQFVLELWKLLLSAQNNIGGIPPEFLEKKKEEIKARKAEQERVKAELSKKNLDSFDKVSDSKDRESSNNIGFDEGKVDRESQPDSKISEKRHHRDSDDRRDRHHNDRLKRDRDHSRERDYRRKSKRSRSRSKSRERRRSSDDDRRKHHHHHHRHHRHRSSSNEKDYKKRKSSTDRDDENTSSHKSDKTVEQNSSVSDQSGKDKEQILREQALDILSKLH